MQCAFGEVQLTSDCFVTTTRIHKAAGGAAPHILRRGSVGKNILEPSIKTQNFCAPERVRSVWSRQNCLYGGNRWATGRSAGIDIAWTEEHNCTDGHDGILSDYIVGMSGNLLWNCVIKKAERIADKFRVWGAGEWNCVRKHWWDCKCTVRCI